MTTTLSRFAALTAGLLFGLTDAHVEAVAWPCAALNVIPAAIPILLATRLAWRFALDGGARRLGAMTLLMVASLTFKEAASGIALVLGATLLTARDRRDGWSRRDRQIVLTIAVQAGIVLLQYLARNNVAGVAGGAMVTTVAAAVHANAYLASHVPVSGIWLPLILAALVALVVFVAFPMSSLASALARAPLVHEAATHVSRHELVNFVTGRSVQTYSAGWHGQIA